MAAGSGAGDDPAPLQTPSGQSECTAFQDETLDPPARVIQVGTTELRYHLCWTEDLRAMLTGARGWVPLGPPIQCRPSRPSWRDETPSVTDG